eukprot:scaffold601_cov496-Prasinococcus_capsulatus_cf.AAC.5
MGMRALTPEQHALLAVAFHAEGLERDQHDKQIVHREALLDNVTRHKGNRCATECSCAQGAQPRVNAR